MTEEQKYKAFIKFMLELNPGVSATLKIRASIERWLDYKIDSLPGISEQKKKELDEMDEFNKIMKGAM